MTNWEKMSEARKKEHTFANCQSCSMTFTEVQALFPVKSKLLKKIALDNPVKVAEEGNTSLRTKNGRVVKPSKTDIKKAAKAMYL